MSAILIVDGLRMRRGRADVLRGVTCAVARGEVVAVMGLSGAGKTTILRAVAGLEPFSEGAVTVDGVALTAGSAAPAAVHQKVGMVFQFHHLFEHHSARENVALALVHVQRTPRAEAERRAQALLDELGVGARAGALPRELSGGEAQRVAIARALANDSKIILADEPTAALDSERALIVIGLLRTAARERGAAILVVTHDEKIFGQLDRTIHLRDGRVVDA
jgi:putative ABC transport system ATP-binding protein